MSIHDSSVARMNTLKAGDAVTNICAGEKNPYLFGFFVAYKVSERKNSSGIIHRTHVARYTDSKGRSGDFGINVIHPGHLDKATRELLFEPVWKERFAKQPQPAEGET